MNTIRVLLADDQILFAESLKNVLETRAEDIHIVGIAHNGNQTLCMVEQFLPDIVLMDVRMPEMDGVEAACIIRKKFPATQIVMLTTFDDDEYVRKALNHGAIGYLLKDVPPGEVIAAVRAAKEGPVLMSPAIAAKLLGQAAEGKPPAANAYDLSRREQEVLELLSQGLNNKEIASRLFLAEQSVKNLVSAMYAKTGAHNRITALKKTMNRH